MMRIICRDSGAYWKRRSLPSGALSVRLCPAPLSIVLGMSCTRGYNVLAGGCKRHDRSSGPVCAAVAKHAAGGIALATLTAAAAALHCQQDEHRGRDVRSYIGYLRHTVEDGKRPLLIVRDGKPDRDLEYGKEEVLIQDARPALAAGKVTLEQTGSVLVKHRTSVPSSVFYTDPGAITTTYYDEVCQIVKEVTGAESVVAIHHQVRNETKALELVGGDYEKLPKFKTNDPSTVPPVDGYAINAHVDYSDVTGPRTAREQLYRWKTPEDRRRHARGRYVMINAWRSISDQGPIQNHHLAVLDGTSLDPLDIVLVDMRYESPDVFQTECCQVSHAAVSRHRWLYFPEMNKDELLLFKQFDSRPPPSAAKCAVHCSFVDPTAPAETSPRESIEVRTIAFFPCAEDDVSGGEGLLAPSAFPPADETAARLLRQLDFPNLWPEDMRQWLLAEIPRDANAAAETVMKLMLDWNSDPENAEGLISGAPDALQQDVLKLLRTRRQFQRKLVANFGPTGLAAGSRGSFAT